MKFYFLIILDDPFSSPFQDDPFSLQKSFLNSLAAIYEN